MKNNAIEELNKAMKLKDEAMKLVNSSRAHINKALSEHPEISKNLDAIVQSTIAGNTDAMEHFAKELIKKGNDVNGNQ